MKTCPNKLLKNPVGCVREFTTDMQLVGEVAEEMTQQCYPHCSKPCYDPRSAALSQVQGDVQHWLVT